MFAELILTTLLLISHLTIEPVETTAGVDLCCHEHSDGTVGCWPAAYTLTCDGWIKSCPHGAGQADPDDEESWACYSNRVS